MFFLGSTNKRPRISDASHGTRISGPPPIPAMVTPRQVNDSRPKFGFFRTPVQSAIKPPKRPFYSNEKPRSHEEGRGEPPHRPDIVERRSPAERSASDTDTSTSSHGNVPPTGTDIERNKTATERNERENPSRHREDRPPARSHNSSPSGRKDERPDRIENKDRSRRRERSAERERKRSRSAKSTNQHTEAGRRRNQQPRDRRNYRNHTRDRRGANQVRKNTNQGDNRRGTVLPRAHHSRNRSPVRIWSPKQVRVWSPTRFNPVASVPSAPIVNPASGFSVANPPLPSILEIPTMVQTPASFIAPRRVSSPTPPRRFSSPTPPPPQIRNRSPARRHDAAPPPPDRGYRRVNSRRSGGNNRGYRLSRSPLRHTSRRSSPRKYERSPLRSNYRRSSPLSYGRSPLRSSTRRSSPSSSYGRSRRPETPPSHVYRQEAFYPNSTITTSYQETKPPQNDLAQQQQNAAKNTPSQPSPFSQSANNEKSGGNKETADAQPILSKSDIEKLEKFVQTITSTKPTESGSNAVSVDQAPQQSSNGKTTGTSLPTWFFDVFGSKATPTTSDVYDSEDTKLEIVEN